MLMLPIVLNDLILNLALVNLSMNERRLNRDYLIDYSGFLAQLDLENVVASMD